MKRDTQEFFDWWYTRIDKFHEMFPYFLVKGFGNGLTVCLKDDYSCSVHMPDYFFLKMIGEDKNWWEY